MKVDLPSFEKTDGLYVNFSNLYDAYKFYAINEGIERVSKIKFSQSLKFKDYELKVIKCSGDSFRGVKLYDS